MDCDPVWNRMSEDGLRRYMTLSLVAHLTAEHLFGIEKKDLRKKIVLGGEATYYNACYLLAKRQLSHRLDKDIICQNADELKKIISERLKEDSEQSLEILKNELSDLWEKNS